MAGMEFTAETGTLKENANSVKPHAKMNELTLAGCGSVWFTDGKVFEALGGVGVWGRVYLPGVEEFTYAGNLAVERELWFAEEGIKVKVEGDLSIGAMGTLRMGGKDAAKMLKTSSGAIGYPYFFSGSEAWELEVGGSLTIAGKGRFEGMAAAREWAREGDSVGGRVKVGGSLTMESGALAQLRCDPTNGASVMVECARAEIKAGAEVSAKDFGFMSGYGPGAPGKTSAEQNRGGAYGGEGGGGTKPYGTERRPYMPGSGGATTWMGDIQERGSGGAIRIRAAGEFVLNGKLNADAWIGTSQGVTYKGPACGSGGGILVECGSFSGSGEMSARGGGLPNINSMRGMMAGGGGRISVCIGEAKWDEATMAMYDLAARAAPAEWTGTARVDEGTVEKVGGNPLNGARDGKPGTVGWWTVQPAAYTHSWTGAAGDGDWANGENWSGGAAPGEGAVVRMTGKAGEEVRLEASTPRYAMLVMEGVRVTATNWLTAVRADKVVVGDKATLAAAGPFTNDVDMVTETVGGVEETWYRDASRVWVECVDFEVTRDGKVDATGKGFAPWRVGSGEWDQHGGTGPGKGQGRSWGAAHGGLSGVRRPYGEASRPSMPGSSGGNIGRATDIAARRTVPGGGVVKIAATGKVRVDGVVAADAEDYCGNANSSSSAGGSVWIKCGEFSGKGGRISATGGTTVAPDWNAKRAPWGLGQASGGRIAVDYGALGETEGMEFDAQCTQMRDNAAATVARAVQNDRFENGAQHGTVWFPDAALFEAQKGRGFAGQLILEGCTEAVVEGGWELDTPVWFAMTNFTLRVEGDLTVKGRHGDLGIGMAGPGDNPAKVWPSFNSGTNAPCALVVAGDLTVTNTAKVFAMPTARVGAGLGEAGMTGVRVKAGGTVTVHDGAAIELASEPYWGSSALLECGELKVKAGGKVSGDKLGMIWYAGEGRSYRTGAGSGHGGAGQGSSRTYGDRARPYEPGAGGGFRYDVGGNATILSRGGSALRLRVKGAVELDGELTACGSGGDSAKQGSAGGSVLVECRELRGAGAIKARGGDSQFDSTTANLWFEGTGEDGGTIWRCQGGAGGGGRVAVWTGPELWGGHPNLKRVEIGAPAGGWTGTVDAGGGTFASKRNDGLDTPQYFGSYPDAQAGTVAFYGVDYNGLVLIVR